MAPEGRGTTEAPMQLPTRRLHTIASWKKRPKAGSHKLCEPHEGFGKLQGFKEGSAQEPTSSQGAKLLKTMQ